MKYHVVKRNKIVRKITIISCLLCLVLLQGCSLEITKKQRDQLNQEADTLATAISYSTNYVLNALSQTDVALNTRLESDEEHIKFAESLVNHLNIYGIVHADATVIDKTEVLIEFFYKKSITPKIPSLLQSWLVIFNYEIASQPKVAAIIPVWHAMDESSPESSYSKRKLKVLQAEFKSLLSQKLNQHSLSLNDNSGQFI